MHKGNTQPESTTGRRRRRGFRPNVLALEPRVVMAIDLVNIAGGAGLPGPFGVQEVGFNQVGGAGWSVAQLGDVNGDGFADFLIGAPTIDTSALGTPGLGNGPGAVYLILGSNAAATPTPVIQDWLNLTAQERVGDLDVLGNTQQTNPTNGQPGFNFNGLTFTAGGSLNNQLGTSVAAVGDVNGDGLADFMIGAPSGFDGNGLPNQSGRAYLIYGSPTLGTRLNKSVDLDNPSGFTDLNILTFTNLNQPNARTGYSVGSAGDFIVDGFPDIAIGAPNASVTGLASQGAVYVVSGANLRTARTATIPLNEVGQQGGLAGVVLTGELSGDAAGFSVASAGNTTGRTSSVGQQIGDLLIGAPDVGVSGNINGNGSAYLVNGDTLANLTALTTTINNFRSIRLNQVGGAVPGAIFNGSALGDRTGWAVSTAGDFNDDGLADILIGSPGFDPPTGANAGRVSLIFGRAQTPNPPGPLSGTFDLSDLPATVPFVQFNGVGSGAVAGFSVSPTGRINNDTINEIIIGSPGVNGGQGQAYLIPGNPDLFGVHSLGATEQTPVQGLIISLSQPSTSNFLGTSVSGRIGTPTADGDNKGDVIIGAPGYVLPGTSRNFAGTGFMLQGAFLPLPNIVSTAIAMGIDGVDSSFTQPFRVNATTPDDMQIYVLSNATVQPAFVPARDLNPASIVVNGVAFPDATIVQDIDRNGDGLPDAIITITPRSSLNLRTSTTTLTVEGRTLPTAPAPNRRVVGSAPIQVTGGGGGGGGGLAARRTTLLDLFNPNAAVPQFGERLMPSPTAAGRLNWRPGQSTNMLIRQFTPGLGFRGRMNEFFHGTGFYSDPLGSKKKDTGYGVTTLGQNVFTRGQYSREGLFDARTWIPRKGTWLYGNPGSIAGHR